MAKKLGALVSSNKDFAQSYKAAKKTLGGRVLDAGNIIAQAYSDLGGRETVEWAFDEAEKAGLLNKQGRVGDVLRASRFTYKTVADFNDARKAGQPWIFETFKDRFMDLHTQANNFDIRGDKDKVQVIEHDVQEESSRDIAALGGDDKAIAIRDSYGAKYGTNSVFADVDSDNDKRSEELKSAHQSIDNAAIYAQEASFKNYCEENNIDYSPLSERVADDIDMDFYDNSSDTTLPEGVSPEEYEQNLAADPATVENTFKALESAGVTGDNVRATRFGFTDKQVSEHVMKAYQERLNNPEWHKDVDRWARQDWQYSAVNGDEGLDNLVGEESTDSTTTDETEQQQAERDEEARSAAEHVESRQRAQSSAHAVGITEPYDADNAQIEEMGKALREGDTDKLADYYRNYLDGNVYAQDINEPGEFIAKKVRGKHNRMANLMAVSTVMPLMNGVNPESILQMSTNVVLMYALSPQFRDQLHNIQDKISHTVKTKNNEMVQKVRNSSFWGSKIQRTEGKIKADTMAAGFAKFQQACEEGPELPMTSMAASMTKVKLTEDAYEAMRLEGVNPELVLEKHRVVMGKLEESWEKAGLDLEEVNDMARDEVARKMAENPSYGHQFQDGSNGVVRPRRRQQQGVGIHAQSQWQGQWDLRGQGNMVAGVNFFEPRLPVDANTHVAAVATGMATELRRHIIPDNPKQSAENINKVLTGIAGGWDLAVDGIDPREYAGEGADPDARAESAVLMAKCKKAMDIDGLSAGAQDKIVSLALSTSQEIMAEEAPEAFAAFHSKYDAGFNDNVAQWSASMQPTARENESPVWTAATRGSVFDTEKTLHAGRPVGPATPLTKRQEAAYNKDVESARDHARETGQPVNQVYQDRGITPPAEKAKEATGTQRDDATDKQEVESERGAESENKEESHSDKKSQTTHKSEKKKSQFDSKIAEAEKEKAAEKEGSAPVDKRSEIMARREKELRERRKTRAQQRKSHAVQSNQQFTVAGESADGADKLSDRDKKVIASMRKVENLAHPSRPQGHRPQGTMRPEGAVRPEGSARRDTATVAAMRQKQQEAARRPETAPMRAVQPKDVHVDKEKQAQSSRVRTDDPHTLRTPDKNKAFEVDNQANKRSTKPVQPHGDEPQRPLEKRQAESYNLRQGDYATTDKARVREGESRSTKARKRLSSTVVNQTMNKEWGEDATTAYVDSYHSNEPDVEPNKFAQDREEVAKKQQTLRQQQQQQNKPGPEGPSYF